MLHVKYKKLTNVNL